MDDVKVILQQERKKELKNEKQMKKKKGLWGSRNKGVEESFFLCFVYKVYSVAKCPI